MNETSQPAHRRRRWASFDDDRAAAASAQGRAEGAPRSGAAAPSAGTARPAPGRGLADREHPWRVWSEEELGDDEREFPALVAEAPEEKASGGPAHPVALTASNSGPGVSPPAPPAQLPIVAVGAPTQRSSPPHAPQARSRAAERGEIVAGLGVPSPPGLPWPMLCEEYAHWASGVGAQAQLQRAADTLTQPAAALGLADGAARHGMTRLLSVVSASAARRLGPRAARALPGVGLLLSAYNLAAKCADPNDGSWFSRDSEFGRALRLLSPTKGGTAADRRIERLERAKAAAGVADAAFSAVAAILATAAVFSLVVPIGGLSLGALAVVAAGASVAAALVESALGLWLASEYRARALGGEQRFDDAVADLERASVGLRDAVGGVAEKSTALRGAHQQLRSLPKLSQQILRLPAVAGRAAPGRTHSPPPPGLGKAVAIWRLDRGGGDRTVVSVRDPDPARRLPAEIRLGPGAQGLSAEDGSRAFDEALGDVPDAERAGWAAALVDKVAPDRPLAPGSAVPGPSEPATRGTAPGDPPIALEAWLERWDQNATQAVLEVELAQALQLRRDQHLLADARAQRTAWAGSLGAIRAELQAAELAVAARTAEQLARVGIVEEQAVLAEDARAAAARLAPGVRFGAALGRWFGPSAPPGVDPAAMAEVGTLPSQIGGWVAEVGRGAEAAEAARDDLRDGEAVLAIARSQCEELRRLLHNRRVVEDQWEADTILRDEHDRAALLDAVRERRAESARLLRLGGAMVRWASAHRVWREG